MTEIHHGLTGHGEILLRNRVKPPAFLHGQTRPLQCRQMFGAFPPVALPDSLISQDLRAAKASILGGFCVNH